MQRELGRRERGKGCHCKMKHSSLLTSSNCNNIISLYNYQEDVSQPAHVKGTSKFSLFLVLKSCRAVAAKL